MVHAISSSRCCCSCLTVIIQDCHLNGASAQSCGNGVDAEERGHVHLLMPSIACGDQSGTTSPGGERLRVQCLGISIPACSLTIRVQYAFRPRGLKGDVDIH